MHTFRKLPKASPRAKVVTAKKGSTLAKCPVCLDLAIICRGDRTLLRYEGDGTFGQRKIAENKALNGRPRIGRIREKACGARLFAARMAGASGKFSRMAVYIRVRHGSANLSLSA